MTTKRQSPRMSANSLSRAGVGRPTKYQPAYAEQGRKLALLGLTDNEMADFFGVSEQTVNNWKRAHPEFFESIKAGKIGADVAVADSLFRAAVGGGTVTELREEADAEGNVITRRTVREVQANVTAQIFFLKNRQPKRWRDKVDVEDTTPANAMTQKADVFAKIMSEARARQRQVLIKRGLLTSSASGDEGE